MNRCRLHTLAALALVCSLGLHWAVLQSVVWTSMLIRFAATDPLPQAIIKTFDGRHPCSMCFALAKAKADEREKNQAPSPNHKLDLIQEPAAHFVFAHPLPLPAVAPDLAGKCRLDPPPLPPPRPA